MSKSNTARRDEENREYLNRYCNDIIEPMMLELVKNRPDN
jgi:hypothetical protein